MLWARGVVSEEKKACDRLVDHGAHGHIYYKSIQYT